MLIFYSFYFFEIETKILKIFRKHRKTGFPRNFKLFFFEFETKKIEIFSNYCEILRDI